MSTNFYAINPFTIGEGYHIGKRSVGWDFLFRAYPEHGLITCTAWHDYLSEPGVQIRNEYGTIVPLDEFWPDAILRPSESGLPMRSHVGEPERLAGGLDAYGLNEFADEHGHPFADYEFC
jgi:hypothetical protein